MRRTQYGRKDRQPNVYLEVREAILYERSRQLDAFINSHRDTVITVATEGGSIDPSVVAKMRPDLIPEMEDHVRSAELQPEVILRFLQVRNGDNSNFEQCFFESCRKFSFSAVLQAFGVFKDDSIFTFVIDQLEPQNCKGLYDFVRAAPSFDKQETLNTFMKFDDLSSLFRLADQDFFEVSEIDDQMFSRVDDSFNKFTADPNDNEAEDNLFASIKTLLEMVSIIKDKANLDRIETVLIKIDDDSCLYQYASMVPDRTNVPNYLSMKEIMNS